MHLNVLAFFFSINSTAGKFFFKIIIIIVIIIIIPCEQRLLSCMAFSVYEVTREACLSRSWLMTLKTLKVMQKDKPLLAGYTYHSISVSFDAT